MNAVLHRLLLADWRPNLVGNQALHVRNGSCFIMSKYPNPLASSLRDVEFSRLSADEIKKISVKRIHIAPTFDTLGGAVPGGLYDPALGAVRALDTTWDINNTSLSKLTIV